MPSDATIQKLAVFFGCEIGDLVADEKKPAAQGDGISDAKRALLAEVDSMTEEELYNLIDIIRAARGIK